MSVSEWDSEWCSTTVSDWLVAGIYEEELGGFGAGENDIVLNECVGEYETSISCVYLYPDDVDIYS